MRVAQLYISLPLASSPAVAATSGHLQHMCAQSRTLSSLCGLAGSSKEACDQLEVERGPVGQRGTAHPTSRVNLPLDPYLLRHRNSPQS